MKINSPKVFSDRKKAELGYKKMLKEISNEIDSYIIQHLHQISQEEKEIKKLNDILSSQRGCNPTKYKKFKTY